MKTSYKFTITYESIIDTDTGEVIETKIVDRSEPISKTPKRKVIQDDGDPEPKLTLEDNKYKLNSAAVALMNLGSDSKLDIKYEESKNGSVPVIGTDESFRTKGGNKISRSNTVACRGSKNSELAKYGTEFKLIPHPNKSGLFILDSGKEIQQLSGDNNVEIDEEKDFLDLNLDDLIDEKDAEITEIDSNFFKL